MPRSMTASIIPMIPVKGFVPEPVAGAGAGTRCLSGVQTSASWFVSVEFALCLLFPAGATRLARMAQPGAGCADRGGRGRDAGIAGGLRATASSCSLIWVCRAAGHACRWAPAWRCCSAPRPRAAFTRPGCSGAVQLMLLKLLLWVCFNTRLVAAPAATSSPCCRCRR